MNNAKWMPLTFILGAFVILSVGYMIATPPFEASDELWHFGMVDTIADNWRLPVQDPDVETLYRQEGSQPPLYYMLSAVMVAPFDRSDFEARVEANPHALVGVPAAVGNKNIVLHMGDFPVGQTLVAVRVLRGWSVLLGVVTLTAIYMTALELGSPRYAWLATLLAAFNPMFLFIAASVNNDNLVTALNSLVIWQLVVMGQRGFGARRSLAIAVLLALSSLSKLSGLVLMPITFFASLYVLQERDDRRGFYQLWVMIVVAWVVLASWWYVRNIVLYGELFGTSMMVQVAGPRVEPFTPLTLLREFEGFRVSYWGLFGGVNVLAFQPYYWLMDGLVVVALVGFTFAMMDMLPNMVQDLSQHGRVFTVRDLLHLRWLYSAGIFAGSVLLGLMGIISWTAQTYASQGRLMFPFIASISLLLATGLRYLWRRREVMWTWGISVSMFALAAWMPFFTIAPAYRPAPTVDAPSDSAIAVYAEYEGIELLAYELPDRRYELGDTMLVTLYWRPTKPLTQDLSLYLNAIGADGELVGKVDSYPGGGTLRTSMWETGEIYRDTYGVQLTRAFYGQFDMQLQVGWWHYPTRQIVDPVDESGAAIAGVMLDAGGFVSGFEPDLMGFRAAEAAFGANQRRAQIVLFGTRQPRYDHYRLAWQAQRRLDVDYTVFVQVIDSRTGEIVGQGDAPPPLSTGYWRRGDVVVTDHMINYAAPLPAGHYHVLLGWYHPVTGERLAASGRADGVYLLDRFTIP